MNKKNNASTCIIHIGMEKTGTSSIQDLLADNRKNLLEQNVLYTRSAGDRGSQIGFVAAAMSHPENSHVGLICGIADSVDHARYISNLTSRLDTEIANTKNPSKVIISSEHFHSRLTTQEEVSRLKIFLDRWFSKFVVILYLRRQDRVAISRYSTKLRSGELDGVFGFDYGGDYYYDYNKLFDNWGNTFGRENINVKIYHEFRSDPNSLLIDFCNTAGINWGLLIPPPTFTNTSLNEFGISLLEKIGSKLPSWRNRQRNLAFTMLADHIYEKYSGKNKLVSEKTASEFYYQFHEGNENLNFKLHPNSPDTLFDLDFSSYPSSEHSNNYSFDDAIDVLISFSEVVATQQEQLKGQIRSLQMSASKTKSVVARLRYGLRWLIGLARRLRFKIFNR